MAAVVTAADISDLTLTLLNELGPLRFQQIGQNRIYYEIFQRWFRRDKVMFDTGRGIQRTLANKIPQVAAHVGFLDGEEAGVLHDVVDQLSIPWRHARTRWPIHYQTDILMNRGRSRIVNVLAPRRATHLIALVEELENKGWAAPASTNKTEPYGVMYWLVNNSTTGFNGGAPTGHTTVGGVSLTDSPTFKNYTAQYTSVTKADLIKKMRTAYRSIRFVSPVQNQDYSGQIADRYRLYVNETTISNLEDVGEGQNENLGRDIAPYDGTITFRRNPIIYVDKLDDESTNPVLMIDHSTFYPVCLAGDYLRETEAIRMPTQPNVFWVYVYITYNYLCVDRRRNARIQTA